jgi:hypothetical protein
MFWMAGASPPPTEFMSQKKPNNLKTALILATLALAFFVGVFVKRFWFS